MIWLLCCLASFFAVALADGWDDFANNLATDLAPFISLFGEQITKQYMSESITMLDYFIFAMAPMGILTAVVSAIRVCGSSKARALIGRAQEAEGIAEAELCSSTSRDVCELHGNGGIARVFGSPKILEIVFDPDVQEPDYSKIGNSVGIYTFQDYIKTERSQKDWTPIKQFAEGSDPVNFAPNLSLNIGIKRQPTRLSVGAAILGLTLQAGVLVFAVVVSYILKWEKEGEEPKRYACPLMIVGTILVCSGIYLCAFLVGQSTEEKIFSRNSTIGDGRRSALYWVQPGGQVIGDQTFDSFCYGDAEKPLQKYTTSWKRLSPKPELAVWVATGITVPGFILQFVGMRGIHSAVSVAQLGAVLAMSAVRAMLRMQRLDANANLLSECSHEVIGHELDWLAIHLGRKLIERDLNQSSDELNFDKHYTWRFCGTPINLNETIRRGQEPFPNSSSVASKLLMYRSRVAELTQSTANRADSTGGARNFKTDMVEVRSVAWRLAAAIESTFNKVFPNAPMLNQHPKDEKTVFWSFTCSVSSVSRRPGDGSDKSKLQKQQDVYLQLFRQSNESKNLGSSWKFKNVHELEALLGLWVWSLKSDSAITDTSSSGVQRIISWNERPFETGLMLWFSSEIPQSEYELQLEEKDIGDPNTLWNHKKLFEASSDKESRQKSANRLFGWHVRDRSPHTGVKETCQVWTTPTSCSLLSLCAQEIFASFTKALINIVEDIGEIIIQGIYQDFQLSNELLSSIAERFTEAQLGSRDEGLLCVLPLVISREIRAGRTPLLYASKVGHEAMVERLLKEGPFGPNRKDSGGRTPLWWAALNGHEAVVRLLLEDNEADPNSREKKSKSTPLLISAASGHEGVVRLLLAHDRIKPDRKDSTGSTPLSLAAANGKEQVVKVLLGNNQVNINSTNSTRATPLSRAAANECIAVVELLLKEEGIDVELEDSNGFTPLSHAAEKGYEDVVKLLLRDGKVKSTDLAKELARTNGHQSVVELLKQYQPGLVNPDIGQSEGDLRSASHLSSVLIIFSSLADTTTGL